MTWKRELAFWAFMLCFCFLLMWGLIEAGRFLTVDA